MSKNDESKFLHDISSPLSVVQGGLEIINVKIQNGQLTELSEIRLRIEKLIKVSGKMVDLLQDRKSVVERDSH